MGHTARQPQHPQTQTQTQTDTNTRAHTRARACTLTHIHARRYSAPTPVHKGGALALELARDSRCTATRTSALTSLPLGPVGVRASWSRE